jgi:hypothetical protein
MVRSLTFP